METIRGRMTLPPGRSRWRAVWAGMLLVLSACDVAQPPATAPRTAPPPPAVHRAAPSEPSAAVSNSRGFRSAEKLDEHFHKHGREFGQISRDEYLRRAQVLRDRPAGGEVLEIRRDDGVISRFDRASGAFVAFDRDGTIRTFFRPNDGEAYFRRQARRRER